MHSGDSGEHYLQLFIIAAKGHEEIQDMQENHCIEACF